MHRQKPLTVSAQELERMRDQTYVWQIDLPEGALQDDEMFLLWARGEMILQRKLNVISCRGTAQVRLRLQSDRTLQLFETEMDVHFDEGLEIVDKLVLPDTLELNQEDAVDQIRVDEPIDLNELLRQYVILSLPMQKRDPENEPENCYNASLSPQEAVDPTWAAIRKTVESWEHPGAN
ncbi:MAG: DUF177 domain-containing protein [Candidatus Sericytochromatia bacterium]|nr:DUF177 domain-containing protein [Candidatus Sericytochromatia bacterium]